MSVNINKTKIIVFRNGGPLRKCEKWFLYGKQIKVVSFYRYLGMIFTPKLIWTQAQTNLAAQALKGLMAIYKYNNRVGGLPCQYFFKIFDAMISPILCYGSEIWGTNYCKVIESVQIRTCKWFLRIGKSSCNVMALG